MATVMHGNETEVVAGRRPSRLLWLGFAAVAAVIAVIGAWFVLAGGDTPKLTFDGEESVYDGPSTFEAGEVTFEFDASAYEPGVAMIVGELTDDSMTLADLKALSAEIPASSPPPPFVGQFDVTYVTGEAAEDRVVEHTVTLREGTRYLLTANTSATDTDTVHPAAIIEVE